MALGGLLAAAKDWRQTSGLRWFVGEGAQRDALGGGGEDISNVKFLPFFPGSKNSYRVWRQQTAIDHGKARTRKAW